MFRMIPGLEQAEIVRYGVMHRNSFIDSPRLLGADYALRSTPTFSLPVRSPAWRVYGVRHERHFGRAQCSAPGRGQAHRLPERRDDERCFDPLYQRRECEAFSAHGRQFWHFAPMEPKIRDKKERYAALSNRALAALDRFLEK